MKPEGHEVHKQHTFDTFCKKVLKNEARNILREYVRRQKKEVLFSELPPQILEQISRTDEYPSEYEWFRVGDFSVEVRDDRLAKALRILPERKRDIVLLAYFLDMRDIEIAKQLRIVRGTVQYQRTKSLKQLKDYLEGGEHGGEIHRG